MPLMRIEDVGEGIALGLWRMAESSEEMLSRYPQGAPAVAGLRHEGRRQERLCVHALVASMTGQDGLAVTHNAGGEPLLAGFSISISHTRGFCAVILGREAGLPLGIDIEYVSDRVEKVRDHFVRSDECASGVRQLLVNWCAKEAAYKFFSGQDLRYDEMFVGQPHGEKVTVTNLRTMEREIVEVETTSEYVLTYIKPSREIQKK